MTTDKFCFYLQNRLIQTSQTGQWYSDTSPFSIPCSYHLNKALPKCPGYLSCPWTLFPLEDGLLSIFGLIFAWVRIRIKLVRLLKIFVLNALAYCEIDLWNKSLERDCIVPELFRRCGDCNIAAFSQHYLQMSCKLSW
jgi:hypothetical protein